MAINRGLSARFDPCEQFVWAYLIDIQNTYGLSAANAQTVKSLCSTISAIAVLDS